MKTCEEYQELVSAYVDGEASDEETTDIFFHLGPCRECRTFMTSVLRLQSALQADEPAPARRHPLLPVNVARAQPAPVWKRNFSVPYPVAAAAIVLMLISGSQFFVHRIQPPEIVNRTQTEYVFVTSLPSVDVVASPLPQKKTN